MAKNIPKQNSVKISPKPPKKPASKTSGKGSKVTVKSGNKKTPEVSYVKEPTLKAPSKADIAASNILDKKPDSTPTIKDSGITEGVVNVQMNKSVYGNYAVSNNLDSEFSELGKTDLNKDISTFFSKFTKLDDASPCLAANVSISSKFPFDSVVIIILLLTKLF